MSIPQLNKVNAMKFSFKSNLFFIALFSFTHFFAPRVFAGGEPEAHAEEMVKGPNGGRLLAQDEFQLELTIFEEGVPPEFHVYVSNKGKPVSPHDVSLNITLKRLGSVEDHIHFAPQEYYLRGDMEIYEPHSFQVVVEAGYQGKNYRWEYDNFEGRVSIAQDIADSMGIATEIAGKAVMDETVQAYGRVIAPAGGHQEITARFEGVVKKVYVELGDAVSAGDKLLAIESNESLQNYIIFSPVTGIVDELNTSQGLNTNNDVLITVLDTEQSEVELDVFLKERERVQKGQKVTVSLQGLETQLRGVVSFVASEVKPNQSFPVRVKLENSSLELLPGMFAKAEIAVANYEVERAVKRKALQAFRDFTVVYAKVGDTYEVRMLELGREAGEWVEVLSGLPEGTEYVTENSYVIKADIEKSGAAHHH